MSSIADEEMGQVPAAAWMAWSCSCWMRIIWRSRFYKDEVRKIVLLSAGVALLTTCASCSCSSSWCISPKLGLRMCIGCGIMLGLCVILLGLASW